MRRRMMFTDANVSKTPAPRHVQRQVCADAPVQLKQEIVDGQLRKRPVGDGKFGIGYPLRQQRSELLVAQDANGGFDVAGG